MEETIQLSSAFAHCAANEPITNRRIVVTRRVSRKDIPPLHRDRSPLRCKVSVGRQAADESIKLIPLAWSGAWLHIPILKFDEGRTVLRRRTAGIRSRALNDRSKSCCCSCSGRLLVWSPCNYSQEGYRVAGRPSPEKSRGRAARRF